MYFSPGNEGTRSRQREKGRRKYKEAGIVVMLIWSKWIWTISNMLINNDRSRTTLIHSTLVATSCLDPYKSASVLYVNLQADRKGQHAENWSHRLEFFSERTEMSNHTQFPLKGSTLSSIIWWRWVLVWLRLVSLTTFIVVWRPIIWFN